MSMTATVGRMRTGSLITSPVLVSRSLRSFETRLSIFPTLFWCIVNAEREATFAWMCFMITIRSD